MRSFGVRVALFIALASPIALWVIAGYRRGALAGGGPVLAASFAGFLSIGVQSMVMSLRRVPESARGELGLFGACVAFFGGTMVSAVIEVGGMMPPVWVHLIPPMVIGLLWAGLVRVRVADQRPLDAMLEVLARADDKDAVADKIAAHFAGLEDTEDAPAYATAVLIVTRPLVAEGCLGQAEALLAAVDSQACPAALGVLLAYELTLVRIARGNVDGARKALPTSAATEGEAERRLVAAARAQVLLAEGKGDAARAALSPYLSADESAGPLDALDEHAAGAIEAARELVEAGIGDA